MGKREKQCLLEQTSVLAGGAATPARRHVAQAPTEMARGYTSAFLQEWVLMTGRLDFREG